MAEILFWGFFSLLFYTYVGYPIVLFLVASAKRRSSRASRLVSWPSVSILLSAHNEESAIRQRLENLLGLDYPRDRLEVFVVSDASTDRTNSIVEEFVPRGVRFLARDSREGKTAALNQACPLAKGEILLFTDANGAVEKDAIKTLIRHFADPHVGCVCGSVRYFDPADTGAHQGESLYMRYDSWIKQLESRLGCVMGAFGGMFAFRKEFFVPMDRMLPVDMEIPLEVLRQGARVMFEPAAVCVEPASGKFAVEFSRHARINARLFYGMAGWLRKLANPFRPFIMFAFLSKKTLRWFSPFLVFALIATSFVLDGPFYDLVAAGNLTVLFAACIGGVLSWLGKSQPVFSFILHFFVGNIAVAWGFVKFITRRQGPTWTVARQR